MGHEQQPSAERPERVRVTGPRTSAARAARISVSAEIDAQTQLGEVFLDSLVRSQLRLALGVTLVLGLTVGALPLVLRVVPAWRAVTVLGVPLPWLLLSGVAYLEVIFLGWLYERRAYRNEKLFQDLLETR